MTDSHRQLTQRASILCSQTPLICLLIGPKKVKYNLHSSIKVSSPIALSALQNSYPSSVGSFRPELIELVFKPMLDFLRQIGYFLMFNAYPFFAYESTTNVISLDYALFRENPGVVDAGNEFHYFSHFDAQIDAVFAALSALKYDDIRMVVTETGWSSNGTRMRLVQASKKFMHIMAISFAKIEEQ
ncbi:hypothetical protein KPL70_003514 [Citrus sinensis]|uniref:glucan endo-1,3-beta-glucosidase 11-like n=1 Tax=Citrus clementina TaxID=85681 RepID=UPI000CECEB55|nr:glucan endo-1,3-beta-glucosidase 11-like [Citrus x clementina]KAH9744024.1 hypothetical protein KPL70_003514 [Citrus sinensis]